MRRWALVVFGVVGLGITVFMFFPVLDNWFISDDLAWLAHAKESPSLFHVITRPAWDGYLRPTAHVVEWLQWKVFGTEAMGYHVVSILLHWANGLLLVLLLGRHGVQWAVGCIAGLVFLFLSRGSEAVYWISAQTVLLATMFSLLALGSWLDFCLKGGARRIVSALLWYVLGLLSMASMLALFPVLVWIGISAGKKREILVLILVTVGYAVAYTQYSPELSGRIATEWPTIRLLLLLARSLLEVYARAWDPVGGSVLWGIITIVGVSFMVRPAKLAASLHWIIILALLPYAATILRHLPKGSLLPFDRYFYIARIGISMLLAYAVYWLFRPRLVRPFRFVRTALVLILVGFWFHAQVRSSRIHDLMYGDPSRRLHAAVQDLRRIDPGAPVRLRLVGIAVPDCWLVPHLSTLFFQGRLRCDAPSNWPIVQVYRGESGELLLTDVQQRSSGSGKKALGRRPPLFKDDEGDLGGRADSDRDD